MKGKAGRTIVVLALAGFLAVTVLCLLNWREFAVEWQLRSVPPENLVLLEPQRLTAGGLSSGRRVDIGTFT